MTASGDQQTRHGQYVDLGTVNAYYEVTGEGDPLVLLHGGMCTAETLDGQTPALAKQYRVYVPERRGHGRTPDVPGPLTYSVMADDTIAFMEAVGIESAHLVGFSDGAVVGLLVALRRPELVRKLVLIGQPANLDGAAPQAREMVASMTADQLPPFLRDLYAATSPDGADHFDAVFERLVPSWRGGEDVALEELARVAAPTLVLAGDNDMITVEHAEAMRRVVPQGQLGIVPGATHALLWERPEITNQLILDFLAAE